MRADYHVHTEFSDDSIYPMELVVQDAISKGIDEIAFTDHVDYGIKQDQDQDIKVTYRNGEPLTNVDYPRYFKQIKKMQRLYGDEITIKAGLEFGIQHHTIDQFESLYRKYPLDFVILSIHQVNDKEFWNQEFQKGKSQQQYNEEYYKELLQVIQNFKHYCVLGHLDLIARYDKQGSYPFEKIKNLITEILRIVIADGKGIEINTSSARYGLENTTPSKEILQLYKELGGTIITIGSDSHKPDHLGHGIDEAKRMLKELGYENYYTFTSMQPNKHLL